MAKLELTGMDELLSKLQDMDTRMANRLTNEALKAGAEVLRAEVEKRADAMRKTGILAGNITASGIKTKGGVKHIEVGPTDKGFYGKFLEFGTTKMAPRPFMGPAMAEKEKEIHDTMRQVLKRGLGL